MLKLKWKILHWLDRKLFILAYRFFLYKRFNAIRAVIWWNRKTAWLFNTARWKCNDYPALFWQ